MIQIFRRRPSESYPSPSSDDIDEEHQVRLERFTERCDGQYLCRIATVHGITLFDGVTRSDIDLQTLGILQFAINAQSRRQQRSPLRSDMTLIRPVGLKHDACLHTLELCVRILVPNARSLSESIGISRNEMLDICAPESLPDKTESWSPRDFYDNVHVPKSEGIAPDVPSNDELQCELYPFQRRTVQWLLWREGAVEAHEPLEELSELPHGFIRTIDGDGRQWSVIISINSFAYSGPNWSLKTYPGGLCSLDTSALFHKKKH